MNININRPSWPVKQQLDDADDEQKNAAPSALTCCPPESLVSVANKLLPVFAKNKCCSCIDLDVILVLVLVLAGLTTNAAAAADDDDYDCFSMLSHKIQLGA